MQLGLSWEYHVSHVFSLCVDRLADLTNRGHQRSLWWTRPTFGLHLHRFRDRLSITHCADNRPSWKLEVFAMLGVRILCFLSPCNLEGCSLILREPGAVRVFPYQVIFPHNNTASNCLTQCSTFGYPAAGMEVGDECCVCSTAVERLLRHSQKHRSIGCGDVEDIANNGGTAALETDCTMACSGDPLHLCGGAQRLQLYLWNGILNNWQIPTNIGRYEVRTKCPLLIRGRACYKAIQRSTSFPALCLRFSLPSA